MITIPWFYPAFKAGGPVQSAINLVNEYEGDTEFYVFCGVTDLNDTPLTGITKDAWVRFNDRTMVYYSSRTMRSDTLVKVTEKLKPDILYITGLFDWHFNIVPLFFGKARLKILSVRGMLHPGALSQKAAKKKIFLFFFKLFRLHKKVVFQVSDLQEDLHVRRVFGDVSIRVAGNYPRLMEPHFPAGKKKGSIRLLSLALISPMKNHLLVLEALSKVTSLVNYDIYGPVKDMEYWQACIEQMKSLPVSIAVRYHGEVNPMSVQDVYNNADVFILPSKSENFGHSIFEALTAGKPVITSHFTPWTGLEAANAGLNIDSDPGAIAAAIDRFASMDNAELEIWSRGAVQYASSMLDRRVITSQYRELFNLDTDEPAEG